MRTTISARHCEVSDVLRDRAEAVFERLSHYSDRVMEGTAIFDTDGPNHRTELRLHVTGGQILVAVGDGEDHRTALDRAEERLARQIKRTAELPKDRRKPAPEKA